MKAPLLFIYLFFIYFFFFPVHCLRDLVFKCHCHEISHFFFPLSFKHNNLPPCTMSFPPKRKKLKRLPSSASLKFRLSKSEIFRTPLLEIGHVRYINILTWLRGFQVKLLYLVLFSLYPSLFWELRDKRNFKNL